jgi:hypothetical protein
MIVIFGVFGTNKYYTEITSKEQGLQGAYQTEQGDP